MLLERCHMSNWWSTSGKFLFVSALIHDTWQHYNNYNSPPYANVRYTQPESGCLHQQADWVQLWPEPEMGPRGLISGTRSKRLTGARGGGGWRSWPKDFIGSDGGSSSWQELIGLPADQFARDRENISQPWGKTSGLQMKYMSFLKPWGETSVLLM